jgi:hypothetical protein
MDRFSETIEFQKTPRVRACPNCKRDCFELIRVPVYDFDGCEACGAECALLISREDVEGEPLCPVEYELLLQADSVVNMGLALEAHAKTNCSFCVSRKAVARETRTAIGPTKEGVA